MVRKIQDSRLLNNNPKIFSNRIPKSWNLLIYINLVWKLAWTLRTKILKYSQGFWKSCSSKNSPALYLFGNTSPLNRSMLFMKISPAAKILWDLENQLSNIVTGLSLFNKTRSRRTTNCLLLGKIILLVDSRLSSFCPFYLTVDSWTSSKFKSTPISPIPCLWNRNIYVLHFAFDKSINDKKCKTVIIE